MYRVEFKKENLQSQDEEVGRIVVLDSGVVKGTLYGEGSTFSSKKEAENTAERFKAIFSPYPEIYRITTEVYQV